MALIMTVLCAGLTILSLVAAPVAALYLMGERTAKIWRQWAIMVCSPEEEGGSRG
jgi:hypothetical protein